MNILIFGPNGSGKGTQGAILGKKLQIPHVESGAIFRENISKGTSLGKKAKEYIDKGELVPDEITIPMILDRLKKDDCRNGWLLDGFPRNLNQAKALVKALEREGMGINTVIEIVLDRETAKKRIMGRRLCVNDNNHPNNIYIDAIKPNGNHCRICGGELIERSDDQDEEAIDKRHNIYYDEKKGTMAAIKFLKELSRNNNGMPKIIEVDGRSSVEQVLKEILGKL